MSAALLRQIQPLEWDASRNEPFLRLPAPLSHIILTPPRWSDAEASVGPLNDPRIFNGIQNPPWPFKLEDGKWWSTKIIGEWNEHLKQLDQAAAQGEDAPLVTFPFCPVRCIRDASTDEQRFIGHFGLTRTRFEWVVDEQERQRLADANDALPPCDRAVIWSVGDWLHPDYHRQGIMSAVAKAIITHWAIPRMNARHFKPTTFDFNVGSAKVFTKLGFKHSEHVPHIAQVKARGEFPAEKRSIDVWELQLDDEGKPVV